MNLAIASGKGGTGKTTVATNLAWVAARSDREVAYLDCDVEAPNGSIFLPAVASEIRPVEVAVPAYDATRCTHCGRCGEICQFSAIVAMGPHVLTFSELCHGCGGCWRVCPSGALTEGRRRVGELQIGKSDGVVTVTGTLDIGRAMSPPVIRAVKAAAPPSDLTILDCPPGTSCPAIESLRGCDDVLLVTEPTPFGLSDLKLAVETCRALGLPMGVVINRSNGSDEPTREYCHAEGLEILAAIPDDRHFAEIYSRGQLLAEASPTARTSFERLLETTDKRADRAVRS